MKRLRNDTFSRPAGPAAPRRRRRGGIWVFVLMFLSVALLVLSKLDHAVAKSIRRTIAEAIQPALSAGIDGMQPLRRSMRQVSEYFQIYKELQRLEQENRELKARAWRTRELERRLAKLRELGRVVKEPELEFVSGRVIAETGGPFLRIALINAGERNGVKRDYPVINGDGLVGRVIDTGPSAARVLLLSDLNSRVPVLVGRKGTRGLLLGDNSSLPRLKHLPQGSKVNIGDEVVTSGVGGIFPRGLRIGVVKGDETNWRVHLFAQYDELEYVSVLFYELPAVEELQSEKLLPGKRKMTRILEPSSGDVAPQNKSRSRQ